MTETTYSTADFQLTFAGKDFSWSKQVMNGLPLLRCPNGLLFEPVLAFFAFSELESRVAIRSMRLEAYSIRQWMVFLQNKGLSIFDATDKLMTEWRTVLGWPDEPLSIRTKKNKKDTGTKVRIERKLHHVFEFYRVLPQAMPFMDGGRPTPIMVAPSKGTINYPITFELVWNSRKKQHTARWARATGIALIPKPPIAATEKEVNRLYTYLRGYAFRVQKRLKNSPEALKKAEVLSDRNWLMAKTMAEGGLRCEEVSMLTVDHLSEALTEAGITEEVLDLDRLADDDHLKRKIKARILSLREGKEYSFVSVAITGKGRKTRYVPFPPQTVCDLLDVGVWTCRRRQVAVWTEFDSEYRAPPYIFLSYQSKGELDEGSIGDIIGKAFRNLGIKKSAHKLRSFFATVTAAALRRQYFAQNQYRFDQALVNRVMDDLARALGHATIDTTVKFYVDKQLFAHLTKLGTAEAKLFSRLWDTVVMGRMTISPKQQEILLGIVERFGQVDDQSFFTLAQEALLNDQRLRAEIGDKPGLRLA
jgi:integrase